MLLMVLPAAALSFINDPAPATLAVQEFKANARLFAASTHRLQQAFRELTEQPAAITHAKQALTDCRLQYKRMEYFMEYFFPATAITFNSAPSYEVEEGSLEEEHEPEGLQVMEALLFDSSAAAHKTELLQRAALLVATADDLSALLYQQSVSSSQLLESIRLEIIRVSTTGIAGYDAPLLKSGISESAIALAGVTTALQPFYRTAGKHKDSVAVYLNKAVQYLQIHPDFDSFDRLDFLTGSMLPLQRCFGLFARSLGMEINTAMALDYSKPTIFSPGAIRAQVFATDTAAVAAVRITLGKQLFYETALSGNGQRSCATCHQPGKYFTDALPKSKGFAEHTTVSRNAPSLLYAGLQAFQFWDGRSKTLEDQVIAVINSKDEMNAPGNKAAQAIQAKPIYQQRFRKAFRDTQAVGSMQQIAAALSAYIRTLQPYNAPFDRYLQGDKQAMSKRQVNGFNLFMGKARCGTCHFAPLFNSLVPPAYEISEAEILGTPATDSLEHPVEDADRGRYTVYPKPFLDKGFKTPGLRNVAVTAPYMHNGAFSTLDKVMEFYNRGGGAGIGLHMPNQTLSPDSLRLSATEMKDIVLFMEALTDKLPQQTNTQKNVTGNYTKHE